MVKQFLMKGLRQWALNFQLRDVTVTKVGSEKEEPLGANQLFLMRTLIVCMVLYWQLMLQNLVLQY
jgi:hypothetical protein